MHALVHSKSQVEVLAANGIFGINFYSAQVAAVGSTDLFLGFEDLDIKKDLRLATIPPEVDNNYKAVVANLLHNPLSEKEVYLRDQPPTVFLVGVDLRPFGDLAGGKN